MTENLATLPVSQRIGESQFNERLTTNTDPLSLPIYRMQQIEGKIHIYSLNFTAWPPSLSQIEKSGKIFSRIVQVVQTSRFQCSSLRDSALLLPPARGGPR